MSHFPLHQCYCLAELPVNQMDLKPHHVLITPQMLHGLLYVEIFNVTNHTETSNRYGFSNRENFCH